MTDEARIVQKAPDVAVPFAIGDLREELEAQGLTVAKVDDVGVVEHRYGLPEFDSVDVGIKVVVEVNAVEVVALALAP